MWGDLWSVGWIEQLQRSPAGLFLVENFLGNDAVAETGGSGSVFLSGWAGRSEGLCEDPVEICF